MNNMLLFVNPPSFHKEKRPTENLGLEYVMSAVDDNTRTDLIDAQKDNLSVDDVANMIISINPMMLAISCNYFSIVPTTVLLLKHLQSMNFEGHICLGGHGAVSCKEKLMTNLRINSLCVCEAENCFQKLVSCVLNEKDYFGVEGFWYKDNNGKIYRNNGSYVKDLNTLKHPKRLLSPDISLNYISTSRGCPFKCSFCDVATFYANSKCNGWRMRDVNNIIDEICELIMKTGINKFYFSDENFIGCAW